MDFLLPVLTADFMGKPAWVWFTFVGIVIALLAFDLGVLHNDDVEIGVRESLLLSAGYTSVALLFGVWVWWDLGAQSSMDDYTGFLIEKSLSMDNVFVIALIFSFFAIPRQYRHRVSFWGILGKIPAEIRLSETFGLIAGGVLVLLWKTRGQPAVAEST